MRPLIAAAMLLVAAGSNGTAQELREVQFRSGIRIPTRDGTELGATIYLPVGAGPQPVILTLTPYLADTYHRWAVYLAQRGYVFAAVDVRGRGNSAGSFEPMVNDGRDGFDVVQWLAKQPWSNGKVAMWGGSYGGFTQWTTIKEGPPALGTIIPIASAYPGLDFPFLHNVYSTYLVQWLTFTGGKTLASNLFGDSKIWDGALLAFLEGNRPFAELDQATTGAVIPNFQRWIAHPTPDPYWDATIPDSAAMARIDVPILTVTGQYDGDQTGAIGYYRDHQRWGTPAAFARHYLVIGPWDHGATRVPRKEIGGLTFGDASLVDIDDLNRRWYDWTLKGGERPKFLEDRVAWYVTGPGAERWKYAPTLAAASAPSGRWFLGAEGLANDPFAGGRLTRDSTARTVPVTSYRYDPLDLRYGRLPVSPDNLTDQSAVLQSFGNGVVYHTPPFAEATEITGFARAALWLSVDVPDTDVQVTLAEIMPDGSSVLLTEQVLRLRYRESARTAKLMTPGQVTRVEFEKFPFFARRISRGSRLRLLVRSPNGRETQRNFNAAGPVERQTKADARVATVTVHHDARHPSFFEVGRP